MLPRATGYVDRVLLGAKRGELPLQQADKYALGINLNTLGLSIPITLLARADEIIE